MLHILHAADLHLDAPFAALTAEQARQRRSEQRQLLDALADAAIERGADLVLLSGDLLDSAQTYRETAQTLAAETGAAVYTLDPVVTGPETDIPPTYYEDVMRRNMAVLREALGDGEQN